MGWSILGTYKSPVRSKGQIWNFDKIVKKRMREYHITYESFFSTNVFAYPSVAPDFTPGFYWGSCYSILSFMCMFCRSLFVLLYFFFWTLSCLFFFDMRILITPLESSNSSCSKTLILSWSVFRMTGQWATWPNSYIKTKIYIKYTYQLNYLYLN